MAPQVFKEIEMTIQAKPEEASKVPRIVFFKSTGPTSMHDQNSKPTQVNTVYLFIIKQGGTPVKRWCEYLLLERLIIMFATFMLYLCIWI